MADAETIYGAHEEFYAGRVGNWSDVDQGLHMVLSLMAVYAAATATLQQFLHHGTHEMPAVTGWYHSQYMKGSSTTTNAKVKMSYL